MIDFGFGVELRAICRTDLSQLRAWRNDKRIWRWCRQNDLISDVAQERWFESQSKDTSVKMYLVCLDNVPIGVCGLTSIDLYNRRAEFSLYIDPDEHCKGLGKKTLQTLFMHGFINLNLNIIWGETFADNPAQKLFENIGMQNEGRRRQFYFKEGQYFDCLLYSITSQEFLKSCSTQVSA